MDKVFISYRRDDAAGYARAIYEELTERFPPEAVFMDVDAIEPGLPFDEVIRDAVGQCKVLLVLIGARWLAPGADGRSRLEDERDFVRLEIAAALARDIRVIPVLLDGTPMPRESDLPQALHALVWRNAIELSNSRFDADVARLTEVLARVLEGGAGEAASPRAAQEVEAEPAAARDAERPGTVESSPRPHAAEASARGTEDSATSVPSAKAGGGGGKVMLVMGALALVAALAWMLWPAGGSGPAGDAGSQTRGAINFDDRPWAVVFGSDPTLGAAQDELRRAARNGVEDTGIYLRNGYYASIALRADRGEADLVLGVVRRFRSDAYVTDMRKWCLQPQARDGFVACQTTK